MPSEQSPHSTGVLQLVFVMVYNMAVVNMLKLLYDPLGGNG